VKFVNEGVERVDLGSRKVYTASGNVLEYEYLVIATGSSADPSLTPGLAEAAYNFHTGPWDAAKIWNALQSFDGGRVVVAIAGVPPQMPALTDGGRLPTRRLLQEERLEGQG
jgi:sulfide:quinone oxidoreductase